MAARKQDTEEQFIKKNHLETIYLQAKTVDSKLWDRIQRIKEHYIEYSKNCEAITQHTVLEIKVDKMTKSEKNAKNFVSLLEQGIIRKNILPNTSEDYSKEQEEKDLQRYKRFLQSFAYDDIKECEVKSYNGD